MAKRLQVKVTIVSAKDLKSSKKVGCFGGKMSPYAMVWTSSDPAWKATAPSAKGQGQHPTWNFRQTFLCGEDSITKGLESLTVELWHKSFLEKKRLLGTVTVPLGSEYLSDAEKPVTGDVLLPSGEKQGVLNCLVKISELAPVPKPYVPPASSAPSVGGDGGGWLTVGGGDGGGPGDGGGAAGCGGCAGG